MLEDWGHKAIHLAGITKEYLALTVLDIFLYIKRNCLGNAEILHVLRYGYTQLSAKLEEMIYRMTRGKHYSGMVKNIDVLLSELLGAEWLHANEWLENKLNAILLSQVKIGRLAGCGLRLGNKNLFYFQCLYGLNLTKE